MRVAPTQLASTMAVSMVSLWLTLSPLSAAELADLPTEVQDALITIDAAQRELGTTGFVRCSHEIMVNPNCEMCGQPAPPDLSVATHGQPCEIRWLYDGPRERREVQFAPGADNAILQNTVEVETGGQSCTYSSTQKVAKIRAGRNLESVFAAVEYFLFCGGGPDRLFLPTLLRSQMENLEWQTKFSIQWSNRGGRQRLGIIVEEVWDNVSVPKWTPEGTVQFLTNGIFRFEYWFVPELMYALDEFRYTDLEGRLLHHMKTLDWLEVATANGARWLPRVSEYTIWLPNGEWVRTQRLTVEEFDPNPTIRGDDFVVHIPEGIDVLDSQAKVIFRTPEGGWRSDESRADLITQARASAAGSRNRKLLPVIWRSATEYVGFWVIAGVLGLWFVGRSRLRRTSRSSFA